MADNLFENDFEIVKSKENTILFKGKDGEEYSTPEELILANKKWFDRNFPIREKEKDQSFLFNGEQYATFEDLKKAREKYWDAQLTEAKSIKLRLEK